MVNGIGPRVTSARLSLAGRTCRWNETYFSVGPRRAIDPTAVSLPSLRMDPELSQGPRANWTSDAPCGGFLLTCCSFVAPFQSVPNPHRAHGHQPRNPHASDQARHASDPSVRHDSSEHGNSRHLIIISSMRFLVGRDLFPEDPGPTAAIGL